MHPIVKVTQPDRADLYLAIVDPVLIGRECDGFLLADEKVSRRHLQLSPSPDGLTVTDLGSTNGSFVNGARVDGESILQVGSTLTLGDTAISVLPPPAVPASRPTQGDVGGTIVATLDPRSTLSDETAQTTTPPPQIAPAPPVPAPGSVGGAPLVRPANTLPPEVRDTSMDRVVASLGSHIELPSGSADDTVTIMFSDIESSTELALSAGDRRWYEILTRHNTLVEDRVAAHGGFIVKNQGDGFMITFNSSRRAIICASEIQQNLHQQGLEDPTSAIRIRIGMHTGEAIRQDSGDLFGRHVIIAARVGAMASGGEILVSSIVREIASARGDLHFGEGALVELKGVGEQTVYPVLWGSDLPAT